MGSDEGILSDQIVRRQPLVSAGYSGNTIERVTLRDGRELVLKRVSPEWDWLSRATNDHGRIVSMWRSGLFDRIPPVLEHATVAVESDDRAWSVFMRDVTGPLFPHDRRLDRASVRRILAGMAELHAAFWGELFPELCRLQDRYRHCPRRRRGAKWSWATRSAEPCAGVGRVPQRGAGRHLEAVLTLLDRPGLVTKELESCQQTLIHGDLRLGNLGLADGRVVLIDWGGSHRDGPARRRGRMVHRLRRPPAGRFTGRGHRRLPRPLRRAVRGKGAATARS